MKVALIKQHGPPSSIVFEDQPIPVPKENEVLIKVKAVGLNHLDTWVRRGVEGHKFPLPIIPGSDFTGVIEKTGERVIVDPGIYCGECSACNSGRENLCVKWGLLGESENGGCREYVALDKKYVHTLPDNLTFEQGAAMPVAYVTAWQMLVKKAKIKSGETILIHAAGSGVSIACIQIAKAIGMHVIVTSTSDDKLHRSKMLGADRFINSATGNFRDSVKNLTAKAGVDVVVDHIGEPTMMDSIRCLKKGGRLVSCGATAGANLKIDWKHVFFKNIELYGSTYGTKEDFAEVLKSFADEKLKPVIDHTMRFSDIAEAHTLIETRKVFGKIILSL